MSSYVGDPFLLANYSIAKHQLSTKGSAESASETFSNVHVTYTDSKSDGFATVAAQGDGVHLLDISTLHPAISHTLGPSTFFACPAVSQIQDIEGVKICSTYVVPNLSHEVEAEHSGRTIWRWRSNLDGVVTLNSEEKLSVLVPRRISKLFVHPNFPSRVILISPEGALTVADEELNVLRTVEASTEEDRVFRVFEYSREQFFFQPPDSVDSTGIVSVVFTKRHSSMFLRILLISDDSEITDLGVTEVVALDVLDISCSNTGHVSVLASNGLWRSFRLEIEPSQISLCDISEPISLASFTFLLPRSSVVASQEVSILPLHSSLILLGAIPSSSPADMVVLLWDLQYSVLLASNSFTLPSTLSRSPTQGISIQLVKSTSSKVIIVLSPNLSSVDAKPQHRSSVLVLPITAPAISTIANAMGRASESSKWISKGNSLPSDTSSINAFDSARRALLGKMRGAMNQKQPQAAEDLFFQWLKHEERRKPDVNRLDSSVMLGYEFTKQVLRLILQPGKPGELVYSEKLVFFLLQQRAVHAMMIEEGFFTSLKFRSDWQSVKLAFDTVRDLPEGEIISLLHTVIVTHKQRNNSASSDAMEVDSSMSQQGIPPLDEYLSLCVSYNYSHPALRLALRQHISEGEDIVFLLKILESWIIARSVEETDLTELTTTKRTKDMPPLDKILSFLQITIDSSFIVLLQYPASHELLRQISSHLEPQLKFINEIRQLCGPLDPFVKAQKKSMANGTIGAKTDQNTQVDWRKRRKQAFAHASANISSYQVEELII